MEPVQIRSVIDAQFGVPRRRENNQLISTLHDSWKASPQQLALNPIYQRDSKVWDVEQRSAFIETLLAGDLMTPPPIYVFSSPPGSADGICDEVGDGIQRCRTCFDYLDDRFKLTGLTLFPELEGKRFSELPVTLRKQLRLSSLPVQTIECAPEKRLTLGQELYRRLNNGTPLKSAEKTRAMVLSTSVGRAADRLFKEDYNHLWTRLCKKGRAKSKMRRADGFEDVAMTLAGLCLDSASRNSTGVPTINGKPVKWQTDNHGGMYKSVLAALEELGADRLSQVESQCRDLYNCVEAVFPEPFARPAPERGHLAMSPHVTRTAFLFQAYLFALVGCDPLRWVAERDRIFSAYYGIARFFPGKMRVFNGSELYRAQTVLEVDFIRNTTSATISSD